MPKCTVDTESISRTSFDDTPNRSVSSEVSGTCLAARLGGVAHVSWPRQRSRKRDEAITARV